MSSERDTAKLWLPHTCFPNAPSHRFLFRQVILQQDQVSRDWGPAGNLVSGDEIKKQSCNSTEEKNSLKNKTKQKKPQHSFSFWVTFLITVCVTFGPLVNWIYIPRRYNTETNGKNFILGNISMRRSKHWSELPPQCDTSTIVQTLFGDCFGVTVSHVVTRRTFFKSYLYRVLRPHSAYVFIGICFL